MLSHFQIMCAQTLPQPLIAIIFVSGAFLHEWRIFYEATDDSGRHTASEQDECDPSSAGSASVTSGTVSLARVHTTSHISV